MHASLPRKEEVRPLSGLRFFLALWVVIFHECVPGGRWAAAVGDLPGPLAAVLLEGRLAVALFFVLSGFVLAYNYPLDGAWTRAAWRRFGAARLARIYPAYVLGLLLVAPLEFYRAFRYSGAGGVARSALLGMLNLALLQAWFPKWALSWNAPGWSLSNEAFFYCCFPLLGVALWRVRGGAAMALTGLALWTWALAAPMAFPAAAALPNTPENPQWLANLIKFHPLLQLPHFCVGILAARVYRDCAGRWAGCGYWFYGGAIVVELAAIVGMTGLPQVLVHNGLLLPVHALLIVGLALGGGVPARWLSLAPVVFLGHASYMLYIIHGPISGWGHLLGWGIGSLHVEVIEL